MFKKGIQYTCTRCGKVVFFDEEDFPQGMTISNTIGTLGWDMVRGKDFCEECMDIFNKWFERFLAGGGEAEVTKERQIRDLESKIKCLQETMKNEKDMGNLVENTLSTLKVGRGLV